MKKLAYMNQNMSVELISEHTVRSELGIVNAARVSFNKQHTVLDNGDKGLIRYLVNHAHWTPLAHPWEVCIVSYNTFNKLKMNPFFEAYTIGSTYMIKGSLWAFLEHFKNNCHNNSEYINIIANLYIKYPIAVSAFLTHNKLSSYLDNGAYDYAEHNKVLVYYFEHPSKTVKITAPIFVARQLAKHQQGFVWNEVSRRYVDYTPEMFSIQEFRERALDKKQGSSEDIIPDDELGEMYDWAANTCMEVYLTLLDKGVCPEQARAVLPQMAMTSWWWTGTESAWDRLFTIRLKDDVQQETREVVELIKNAID